MMSPVVPSMFFIQIHASSQSKKNEGGEPPLLGSKFWHNMTELSNTKIKRLLPILRNIVKPFTKKQTRSH